MTPRFFVGLYRTDSTMYMDAAVTTMMDKCTRLSARVVLNQLHILCTYHVSVAQKLYFINFIAIHNNWLIYPTDMHEYRPRRQRGQLTPYTFWRGVSL